MTSHDEFICRYDNPMRLLRLWTWKWYYRYGQLSDSPICTANSMSPSITENSRYSLCLVCILDRRDYRLRIQLLLIAQIAEEEFAVSLII